MLFGGFSPYSDPLVTGSRLTVSGGVTFGNTGDFERPNRQLLTYSAALGPMLFIAVPEPSSLALLVTDLLLLRRGHPMSRVRRRSR